MGLGTRVYKTAVEWASENPVLEAGVIGLDTTNNQYRIGDGTTNWTGLTAHDGATFGGAGGWGPGPWTPGPPQPGQVDTIVAGDNVTVNNANPANPVVAVPQIPAEDVQVDTGDWYAPVPNPWDAQAAFDGFDLVMNAPNGVQDRLNSLETDSVPHGVGPLSSRPPANGTGPRFLDTDTGIEYVAVASQWMPVEGASRELRVARASTNHTINLTDALTWYSSAELTTADFTMPSGTIRVSTGSVGGTTTATLSDLVGQLQWSTDGGATWKQASAGIGCRTVAFGAVWDPTTALIPTAHAGPSPGDTVRVRLAMQTLTETGKTFQVLGQDTIFHQPGFVLVERL